LAVSFCFEWWGDKGGFGEKPTLPKPLKKIF
jgi:hypothetical protein